MEEIRLVLIDDIDRVMEIIQDAKTLLKASSLQWQNGYPEKSDLINDINNKFLYGLYVDNILVGIEAIIKGKDNNYIKIDGRWINDTSDNDLVVHRVAAKKEYYHQKVGDKLIKYAIEKSKKEGITSLKIDTHKANIPMQKLCLNNGFKYCGIISILREQHDPLRYAYEYPLNENE